MEYDFSTIEEEDPYLLLPEGVHLVRIADVRTGLSKDGSERWSLRLEAVGGEWAGRTAAWDNLTWSERGVHRVKKVLEALGFDVGGRLAISPDDLLDLKVLVQLRIEDYENAMGHQRRLTVPYLGYTPAGSQTPRSTSPSELDGAMPF